MTAHAPRTGPPASAASRASGASDASGASHALPVLPAWHAASVTETFAALDTSPGGLTTADAALRLARVRPERTRAATIRPASILSIFVDQVLSLPAAMANPAAIGALVLSLGLQIAALLIAPLAAVLRLTPLGWQDWAVIVTLSALPAVAGQLLKLRRQRQLSR